MLLSEKALPPLLEKLSNTPLLNLTHRHGRAGGTLFKSQLFFFFLYYPCEIKPLTLSLLDILRSMLTSSFKSVYLQAGGWQQCMSGGIRNMGALDLNLDTYMGKAEVPCGSLVPLPPRIPIKERMRRGRQRLPNKVKHNT